MFQIECPSGLIIEAKPLHGRDVIAIAERVGGNASGETIAAFMSATTVRVLDPGPYPFLEAKDGSPPWPRLLWGDLLAAIFRLRVLSFPDHRGRFDFEFSCPHCKALTPASTDLEELLADPDHFHGLPRASVETMLAHKLFETTLPSGAKVAFDLARMEQDEPMRALMRRFKRRKETDVERAAKQTKRVEGLKEKKTGQPATDLASFWRWAESIDANDLDALLAAMQNADVMVDTRILAWCLDAEGVCGRQSRIALPLDTSFFRPRSATKRAATEPDEDSPPSSPASTGNGG